MYFIGIDIGTTNCKICLFKLPDFSLISKHSFKTPKIILEETSDFDINKLWEGIENGLESISKAVINPEEIINISIASIGEAGVLIDEYGNIRGPVMTWYDTRTKHISENIIAKIGMKEIYEITGLPAHSNYSLNKILWIKENTEGSKNHYKWLCMSEFIAYKLTGIKKSEYSLASRTMALDIKNKKWSDDLLKILSLNEDIFSDLVSSGKEIGTLKNETAKKTNLSTKTTVSIGGHDHMCGSIAAGLYDEHSILNSTGTTEGLLFLQKNPGLGENFYNSNFSNGIHVLENFYTIYSSLPSAGYSIEWFKNKFQISDEEFNIMIKNLYLKISDKNYLPETNAIFIPHLRGSGPPRRSIKSQALFYGITENTTKEDLLLIIFQSLCFELKNLLESIEKLTSNKFKEIKVIGTACKNELWMKLKSDILGKEILSYEIDEAVSMGVAVLSTYKNNYIDDLSVINNNLNIKKILPNKRISSYYENIYENFYKPFYKLKMDIEKTTG